VQAHLEVRLSLALARCGRLWPAAAGCGQMWPDVVWPSQAMVRPDLAVVRPDLARCGQHCTIALVQISKGHLLIVIPIFVYLQVKMPTKLVELHYMKFVISSSHS
jgi:hypothetical protein